MISEKGHLTPLIGPDEEGEPPKRQLKVCIVAFGEMGHLIPLTHIADILAEAGHEVYFLANGNDYVREKLAIFLADVAVKEVIFTDDGIPRELIMKKHPKLDSREHCMDLWAPYVLAKVAALQPDIIINDFLSRPGADAAEALGIPYITNIPGPLNSLE